MPAGPRKGRPVRRRVSGNQSADDGADVDRRRHQTIPVVGYPRISRREVSRAAAITGRLSGAGLGARARIDQRGRLPPADRAACATLSDRHAECEQEQRLAWIQHWLGAGLAAIEALLAEHPASGRFCHDDGPTVADICLVTQVTPAKTLNLSLDPYPRVMRVLTPAWPSPTLPMPTQQSSPTRNKESSGVTLESLAPSSAPETGSGRSTPCRDGPMPRRATQSCSTA